jgi:SAM-dependent methyltransferase
LDKSISSRGNSGGGSYNRLAEFKAEVLNGFVASNNISTILELGCGDGNQLKYFIFPKYLGYDISSKAIGICKELYKNDESKEFHVLDSKVKLDAELSISLDVVYHLLEDVVFDQYMRQLFDAASRYVIIYSSNTDDNAESSAHVRHRAFTKWIDQNASGFELKDHIPNKYPYTGDNTNSSFADFYIYERKTV